MRPALQPGSRAVRLLPAVAWAGYVLVASVVDPGGAGGAGLPATGPLGLVGADKWLHAGTYATLAFLVAAGLSAGTGRTLLAAALVAVAFGAGVELVQYPLPARRFDAVDALANAVGAGLGVGAWVVARRAVAVARGTA